MRVRAKYRNIHMITLERQLETLIVRWENEQLALASSVQPVQWACKFSHFGKTDYKSLLNVYKKNEL